MWYFIIGICIGFVVGNFFGFLCACLMAAASKEDRRREFENCYEILEEYERRYGDGLQRHESNNQEC